jgi:hypothetical protein
VLLIVGLGTVKASEPGYDITEWYIDNNDLVVDGKWTTTDEWHDCSTQYIGTPHIALFEYKIDATTGFFMEWLIEFADKTNDAGDKWQICLDGGADGGSAPNANDQKWEIVGHTTLTQYVGNGSGWATQAINGVAWKDSLTTSPHDPATHWVLEFAVDKDAYSDGWGANPPPEGLRVAMYDASNPSQGWVAWPPQSVSTDTNPARWGSISTYSEGAAPEGLTISAMLILSTIAMIVSLRYYRKRPKWEKV